MATFYATCLVFIFVVLGSIALAARLLDLEVHQVHQGGTPDRARHVVSSRVLPRMMAKLENLGAKKSVVGLVIPTGYSFNLDGTSIYLTMAAVFIAQATNTPLTLRQQMLLACCC